MFSGYDNPKGLQKWKRYWVVQGREISLSWDLVLVHYRALCIFCKSSSRQFWL